MKRTLAFLLAAGSAAWSLLASLPHPSLPSGDATDGLGVNIHFTDPRPGEMEMLASAGFHWVRMDFSWSGTQKNKGEYDFSAYDRLLTALESKKIRAVLILDYGNSLYGENGAVTTEAGRQAFSRWAGAAVLHFKGHGILWEIWNEPNGGFWKPHANVDEYAALALAASQAIRGAAPGEAIIGPATSGVDLKFLEGCFKAGLLDYWDAVSVHPYRQSGPESAAADYQKLRKLNSHYAPMDKSIPILSGEWGYSSVWQNFDNARQARMLAREWLVNLASHIPLSIWYDWHDDGTDPKDGEHHFGTVLNAYHSGAAQVYEPKPAYLAAKTLTSVLRGFHFTKRLALGSPDDCALLFSKGDESRLAAWTTSPTPRPVKIPSSPGEFEVIAINGERARPITATEKHLVLTLKNAPEYIVFHQANPLLHSAPAARNLRAKLGMVGDQNLAVQIENLDDTRFNGEVWLTGNAIRELADKSYIELEPGETSPLLSFNHPSESNSEITAGLQIESRGVVMLDMPPRRFHSLSDGMLTGSLIAGDGDGKVASQQSIAASKPPEPLPGHDGPVQKVSYQCDAGWKFFRVIPPEGESRSIKGEPTGFGIWIYGDKQGISPRLRLIDATGQTLQPGSETIDWTGWRYIEFDFKAPAGHWGGADDGIVHFPIRWDTLLLLDNVSRQKSEGMIYVAAPSLIYE